MRCLYSLHKTLRPRTGVKCEQSLIAIIGSDYFLGASGVKRQRKSIDKARML